MQSFERVKAERDRLMVVAAEKSQVPDVVRHMAQMVCHTLTWVLGDMPGETTRPYEVIAGCCCEPFPGEKGQCALGPGMCLCPGPSPAELELRQMQGQ